MVCNGDETVLIVEAQPGQGRHRDLKVVVPDDQGRAALRESRFAKTNVAYVPFITEDGLVADVTVFPYDEGCRASAGFKAEHDRLKKLISELPEHPTAEQVEEVLTC